MEGEGHKKEHSVYTFENVDNSGRPLMSGDIIYLTFHHVHLTDVSASSHSTLAVSAPSFSTPSRVAHLPVWRWMQLPPMRSPLSTPPIRARAGHTCRHTKTASKQVILSVQVHDLSICHTQSKPDRRAGASEGWTTTFASVAIRIQCAH